MVTENNKVEGEVFTNFECAAAFLSVRLISYQKNKEFLSLVPHRRILDLAIIYQLFKDGGKRRIIDAMAVWNKMSSVTSQIRIKV